MNCEGILDCVKCPDFAQCTKEFIDDVGPYRNGSDNPETIKEDAEEYQDYAKRVECEVVP